MQVVNSNQETHRPGPLHQTNKAHKGGRHSRKSSATSEIKNKALIKPGQKLKREERLNQANQERKLKRERVIEEKRKLGTDNQPPLLIGVLDLYDNSCQSFFTKIQDLRDEKDQRDQEGRKARKDQKHVKSELIVENSNERVLYVTSSKLKMRFKLIALDSRNFDETLDLIKSLDLLLMLHKPGRVESSQIFNKSELLRAIRIHCLPTIIHVMEGIADNGGNYSAKVLTETKRALRSEINEDKMHSIERIQDFEQLFHLVGNCKRQLSQFKDARATVVPDKVELVENSLTYVGHIRKKALSPNDLVHIVGYGDFQIKKIDILTDTIGKDLADEMTIIQTYLPDPMKQEDLEQENKLDELVGEQTWTTAEELERYRKIVKTVTPGTSDYQLSWLLGESDDGTDSHGSSDDESDTRMKDIVEEDEDDDIPDDASSDGIDEHASQQDEEISPMDVEEYDKNHSKDKELKILEKLKEARLDEMFPDEVDTPANIPARLRFAKYRGLKSFRTSPWDPEENLPPDYSRIFQFHNFHQTKRRVLDAQKEEGAEPGQYVRVYLSNVPEEISNSIRSKTVAPNLIGLLKHERKMTVMNILIKRVADSNLRNPIKSKEELTFYVGFRKFKARPLFTTHSISSKFKYERFLRDDVAMVATIYAPITFPPAPVLVFRTNYKNEKELVASGSVLDSDPKRLIVKRIRLSGHPFKIHSKSAVVRFMFFDSEDVMYFKPVELTSKYSRRGHITEPLGTHGHMKCSFDKKIRSDDCIFMNLYKRVFPKWTYLPIYDL